MKTPIDICKIGQNTDTVFASYPPYLPLIHTNSRISFKLYFQTLERAKPRRLLSVIRNEKRAWLTS